MNRRIAGEILELLKAEGPLLHKDVRTRLMVSSQAAFDAAVYLLKEEHRIECDKGAQKGAPQYLRLVGDNRPLPETMMQAVKRAYRCQPLRFGARQ